ncbi:MAG TPA: membrane dipeptidase [Conexibacter sp.]|nr:membrane dipeptidase [Conexibacter sp.]
MLVDLHAHYPMHLIPPAEGTHAALRAWPSERWRARIVDWISRIANYEGPGDEPGVTIDLLHEGRVGVALSVLYQPFDEMDFGKRYGDPPDPAYFQHLLDQMDLVEQDVAQRGGAQVARTGAELEACLAEQRLALVHAVEGGFHLGAEAAAIERNVAELARRGVAYVTLAHLFWRGIATNAPALPFLPDWLYRLLFPQPRGVGLTDLGRAAVRGMVAERMLVDVTHMSERSLADTFALLDQLDPAGGVPVIATHMACRFGGLSYNLLDDAIERIARRGGVMGVIDCRHYVTDRRLRSARDGTPEDSIELICAQIDHIAEVTGSFEHAAIGTDLDGYIKPALKGLEHAGCMGALQDALERRYGAERARKVCSENALRVLRVRFGR